MSDKTTTSYWDSVWAGSAPYRHTTPLNVSVADRRRLIAKEIKPGCKYMEIGCAPGIFLAYAQSLGAVISGLDYSPIGIEQTQARFNPPIPLYCEDVLNNSAPKGYFDVVHSGGLIEHFDDPRPIINAHLDLLKSGGVALITIPNFGGVYGKICRYTHPELLAIHNLNIMSPEALASLVPDRTLCSAFTAFRSGRMSLSNVAFTAHRFGLLAKAIINVFGLIQPFQVSYLAPTLVLKMIRA